MPGDRLGQLAGDGAVRGDDAAVRRHRVARVRAAMGVGDGVGCLGRRDRDAARVGVLDDRHGGLVEVEGGAHRGIRVDVVVVGHLLAVQLHGLGDAGTPALRGVERRALVRVLAVAEVGVLRPAAADPRREGRVLGGLVGRDDAADPRRDGDVVRRRVRGTPRERTPHAARAWCRPRARRRRPRRSGRARRRPRRSRGSSRTRAPSPGRRCRSARWPRRVLRPPRWSRRTGTGSRRPARRA